MTEEKTISSAEIKELIEKEKSSRIEKCGEELTALLRKYNCSLDVTVILKQDKVIPTIGIIANSE